MEISEQQTSCTNLKKQIEELQMELRSVRTLKKQQARIQFLLHYLIVFSECSSVTLLSPSIIKGLLQKYSQFPFFMSPVKMLTLLISFSLWADFFPFKDWVFNTSQWMNVTKNVYFMENIMHAWENVITDFVMHVEFHINLMNQFTQNQCMQVQWGLQVK